MVMAPGRIGYRGGRDVSSAGICTNVAGKKLRNTL